MTFSYEWITMPRSYSSHPPLAHPQVPAPLCLDIIYTDTQVHMYNPDSFYEENDVVFLFPPCFPSLSPPPNPIIDFLLTLAVLVSCHLYTYLYYI